MATVCAGAGGRLIRVGVVSQAAPLSLALSYGGEAPVVLSQLGVALSVQASQTVRAQFQNALNDTIFVTPFGDAPGQVQVMFVANRLCNGSGAESSGFGVLQHYFDRRLRPGTSKAPAIVTIGPASFRAFLTGLVLSGSTQDTPVIQGALTFTAWPM